jgi:hypothetical protein
MTKKIEDQNTSDRDAITDVDAQPKKPFLEPKLAFIEPKLTKHGDATKITQQGFFGTFTP